MGLGSRSVTEAHLGVGLRSWAHLWGGPGVCYDLGAPVAAPKCLFTSVAPSSMVSRVFMSWLRVLVSGFGWEKFSFSECDWFILLIRC